MERADGPAVAEPWARRWGINAPFLLTLLLGVVAPIGVGALVVRDAVREVEKLRLDLAREVTRRDEGDRANALALEQVRMQAQRDTDVSRAERNREMAEIRERLAALAAASAEQRGEERAWRAAQERFNSSITGWMARQEDRVNRLLGPRQQSGEDARPGLSSWDSAVLLPYTAPRLPGLPLEPPATMETAIPPRTAQAVGW